MSILHTSDTDFAPSALCEFADLGAVNDTHYRHAQELEEAAYYPERCIGWAAVVLVVYMVGLVFV